MADSNGTCACFAPFEGDGCTDGECPAGTVEDVKAELLDGIFFEAYCQDCAAGTARSDDEDQCGLCSPGTFSAAGAVPAAAISLACACARRTIGLSTSADGRWYLPYQNHHAARASGASPIKQSRPGLHSLDAHGGSCGRWSRARCLDHPPYGCTRPDLEPKIPIAGVFRARSGQALCVLLGQVEIDCEAQG